MPIWQVFLIGIVSGVVGIAITAAIFNLIEMDKMI